MPLQETATHRGAKAALEARHPGLVFRLLREETTRPRGRGSLRHLDFIGEPEEGARFDRAPRFFRARPKPGGGWELEPIRPENRFELMQHRGAA